jgi:large subunit ribosomal protein L17
MAVSLILSSDDGDESGCGGINTTLQKAKYLRPYVEKLVTLSKRAALAMETVPNAPARGDSAWENWRHSPEWVVWANSVSVPLALRRRAFSKLRSNDAVNKLFDVIAARYRSRQGGYLRIVRLTRRRVGDSGRVALIEFVGENDRRSN